MLHVAGALGPVGAAVIVTMRTGGRPALGELLRSTTRWRAGPRWLVITIVSPLALFAVAALLTRADLTRLSFRTDDPVQILEVLVISTAYGLGEEPGWRGFMLPRLQARHEAWTATVLLALVWAAWHAPFFVYRYPFGGAGMIAGFVVSLFAGALWLTFLYNSTGGSVLAVALWHTIWNALNLSMGAVSEPTVTVANALVLALALGGVLLGGPRRLCWSPARHAEHDA
jgi:membrane protease YdiL (CAAX protease family)